MGPVRVLRRFLPTSIPPGVAPAASPPVLRDRRGRLLVRRPADRIQAARRLMQVAFALLNVWIGIQFYRWVRHYETGGLTDAVSRPAGVEGWLPIASLMGLKYWVLTWDVPDVHPAGMFLLLAFLLISWLVRKAFCSWLCPIGALSEVLREGGREIFGRSWALPRWIDVPLRSLKYILLGLFLHAIAGMSTAAIHAFLTSPYGLIADVKMLDFFRAMGRTTAVVLTVLVLASVVVSNPWCRYLCPYGALMGLASMVGPTRIRRHAEACIECGKCAQACPSLLPVDRLSTVRSAECTACLLCVSACPSRDALEVRVGRWRQAPGWAIGAATLAIFATVVIAAKAAGYWETHLPDDVLRELIPRARAFAHP